MANNTFRDSVNSLGWSRRDPDFPVRTNNSTDTSVFSRLQSYNPFGQGGYVQLPTHNEAPGAPLPAASRREEEEGFFALSRWDRMLVFAACNLGAAICFMLCFFLFPVLTLKPRKFAILWSVGSTLFLLSWAVLMGPWTYARHLVSGPRLPFTAAYFGSIALTLYFAIGLRLHNAVGKKKGHLAFSFSGCLGYYLIIIVSVTLRTAKRFAGQGRERHRYDRRYHPLQSLILTAISSVFQICALIWYLVSYFPMGSTGLQYMSRFGASRVTAWMSG